VWLARPVAGDGYYLAVFNLDSITQEFRYSWKDVELPEGKYRLRNLWERKDTGSFESLRVSLPTHASVLYKVSRSP